MSSYEYGQLSVQATEIINFAEHYDPQFFHVNPVAAANGPFGGLIASGWHPAGLMMRLYVEHYLSRVASLGAAGVEELRWPAPLRPGDTVRLRVRVVEAIPRRSRLDRGVVRTLAELMNQNGEKVLHTIIPNILLLRPH